jgi:hypothetical protein
MVYLLKIAIFHGYVKEPNGRICGGSIQLGTKKRPYKPTYSWGHHLFLGVWFGGSIEETVILSGQPSVDQGMGLKFLDLWDLWY